MPFPTVYGIPEGTSKTALRNMRRTIIKIIAESMNVPERTVRPFFPADMVGDPSPGEDDTIYCKLDTGMFNRGVLKDFFATIGRAFGWKDPDVEKRKLITNAVANVIWLAFDGRYEVEVFIGDLNSSGKTILKPRKYK